MTQTPFTVLPPYNSIPKPFQPTIPSTNTHTNNNNNNINNDNDLITKFANIALSSTTKIQPPKIGIGTMLVVSRHYGSPIPVTSTLFISMGGL